MARYTASMPLLPSALPPKGEARRYVANDFLNLIALPRGARCFPFPALLTVSPDRERKRFLAFARNDDTGKRLCYRESAPKGRRLAHRGVKRASQRGTGSILRLFTLPHFPAKIRCMAMSNVLPHRHRGQGRPARGIPLCGYSL